MAQRKQLTWSELKVGIFVLVGLFILAIAVFYVSGGGILGPKYRLTTYLSEVDGLADGRARFARRRARSATLRQSSLTPHPQDRDHSITLTLRIDKKFQNDIRTDSSASLVTQGLLGDRYVTVSRGLTGTPLPPNGILPGHEEAAMKQMVERGADLMQNLGALTDDLKGIVDGVHNGKGTLGKLMNDPTLYNHLDDTVAKIDSLAASIQQGQGSMGKLITDDDLYNKVDSAVGKADDVLGAVRDQKGSLGKLVYDPSAYDSIKRRGGQKRCVAWQTFAQARVRSASWPPTIRYSQPARCVRECPRRHRETQFQSRHSREALQRPEVVRQFDGFNDQHERADQRFPPEPEEIPAHQAGHFSNVSG